MKKIWYAALLAGALTLTSACGDDDETPEATAVPGGGTTAASPAASAAASPSTAAAKPSTMDSTFGTAGVLAAPISTTENDRFMAVAFAPDGSYYAAGYVAQSGDHAMAVAKYKADGKLDTTYGKDGYAIANVASGGKTAEVARAIAVQSTGKVVIGGVAEHDTTATGDAARDTDMIVVRFDTKGVLDTTFGNGGIARIDANEGKITTGTTFVGDNAWGLATLPGDKVAIFGSSLSKAAADRTDTDYVLVGIGADGKLDSGFGTAGYVWADGGTATADNPRNISLTADNKIVTGGYSTINGVVQPVFLRTSLTGQLDTTWGQGGKATAQVLPGVAESYGIVPQGNAFVGAGYGRGADTAEKVDMILYRFTGAGAWDKTFGTEGVTRLDLAKEDDRGRALAVLPDNRILVVGSGKMDAANVNAMIFLADRDGKAAAGFGTNGYVLSDLGGPADAWYGVAISPDKKTAIVVGYKGVDATSGGNDDSVIARITL